MRKSEAEQVKAIEQICGDLLAEYGGKLPSDTCPVLTDEGWPDMKWRWPQSPPHAPATLDTVRRESPLGLRRYAWRIRCFPRLAQHNGATLLWSYRRKTDRERYRPIETPDELPPDFEQWCYRMDRRAIRIRYGAVDKRDPAAARLWKQAQGRELRDAWRRWTDSPFKKTAESIECGPARG